MPPGRGAKARLRDAQQARTLSLACPSVPSWTLVQALYSSRGHAAGNHCGITKLIFLMMASPLRLASARRVVPIRPRTHQRPPPMLWKWPKSLVGRQGLEPWTR